MKKVLKVLLVLFLCFVITAMGYNGLFDIRFWHLPGDERFVNLYDGEYLTGRDFVAGEYEGYWERKSDGGTLEISVVGADGMKKPGVENGLGDGFHIVVEDGDFVFVRNWSRKRLAMRRIKP